VRRPKKFRGKKGAEGKVKDGCKKQEGEKISRKTREVCEGERSRALFPGSSLRGKRTKRRYKNQEKLHFERSVLKLWKSKDRSINRRLVLLNHERESSGRDRKGSER